MLYPTPPSEIIFILKYNLAEIFNGDFEEALRNTRMPVFSLCSMGTGCSTPAVPRTSLALFPSYSKLAWLCTHGGVIPKGETLPELVAFSFVKS